MNDQYAFLKEKIIQLAREAGWQPTYTNTQKQIYGFRNFDFRCHLEIVWSPTKSMKVITCMRHPRAGVSILMRDRIGFSDVKQIFNNPRLHTNRGRRLD